MGHNVLFKYGSVNTYSQQIFRFGNIWFSSPSQLNDPFECRPWFKFEGADEQILQALLQQLRLRYPNKSEDEAVDQIIALHEQGRHRSDDVLERLRNDIIHSLSKNIGIFCLSKTPDNILMWSHYASNHQGYCLEFEASTNIFGAARAVKYSKDYPVVDFFNVSQEEQASSIFLYKYDGWSYEQEYRIIDHTKGAGLRDYPVFMLKSLIFGLRMTDKTKEQIYEWVGRRSQFRHRHSVQFFQAEQNNRKFSIDIRPL